MLMSLIRFRVISRIDRSALAWACSAGLVVLVLLVCSWIATLQNGMPPLAGTTSASRARIDGQGPSIELYDKVPLVFEANRGQVDERVNFLSRGRGYTLFLTPEEAVFALEPS